MINYKLILKFLAKIAISQISKINFSCIYSVSHVRCEIGQNKVGGLNARAHIKLNSLYQNVSRAHY